MKISLIAAMANNRIIGRDNKMPWHLPADLKHFKQVTMGKPVIMGRKTFESIGKPLPGRQNIIITRQSGLALNGCDIVHSIEDAIALVKNIDEVMIIGGGTIYESMIDKADRLYITLIELEADGDTQFPAWNEDEWSIIDEEPHLADDKNPYNYRFITLERKV